MQLFQLLVPKRLPTSYLGHFVKLVDVSARTDAIHLSKSFGVLFNPIQEFVPVFWLHFSFQQTDGSDSERTTGNRLFIAENGQLGATATNIDVQVTSIVKQLFLKVVGEDDVSLLFTLNDLDVDSRLLPKRVRPIPHHWWHFAWREVAQARYETTSCTPSNSLKAVMVSTIFSHFVVLMVPEVNTSAPKRMGTRTKDVFLKMGPLSPSNTLVISSLTAFDPISMAPNFSNSLLRFCVRIWLLKVTGFGTESAGFCQFFWEK